MYQLQRRPKVQDKHLNHVESPLIRQIYARRGMLAEHYPLTLKQLLRPDTMHDLNKAAVLVADTLIDQQRILIVGDFDADGATSTAICCLALRQMGAQHVDYLIPNRLKHGYGLSPALVELAHEKQADLLITVDNGISSFDGVAAAHALDMNVVITDHHVAGNSIPPAEAVVNPNQPLCSFESKSIAGCGVAFYLMTMIRQELVKRDWFHDRPCPNLGELLDFVALGTVADVVPLDTNNRILVEAGLQRIRRGRAHLGIKALMDVAQCNPWVLDASSLGFALAPRLNAAGRLDDMCLGVELLLSDDLHQARDYAKQLDALNKERRTVEQRMKEEALDRLEDITFDIEKMPLGLALFDENWHQGVIGILASRLKDRYYRPVIAFAPSDDTYLKGSARSIAGVHIRDVLQEINAKQPEFIEAFGGHAMAAGLTLKRANFSAFSRLYLEVLQNKISDEMLHQILLSDGELEPSLLTLSTAHQLKEAGPWGQHFPEPVFDGTFFVLEQKLLADKHVHFSLMSLCRTVKVQAIWFQADLSICPNDRIQKIHLAYRMDVNYFRGKQQLQLIVLYAKPSD